MDHTEVMDQIYESIKAWFAEHGSDMTKVSDSIWELAEVKFEEFQSSALLKDTFRKYGFTVKENVLDYLPTAFIAEYSNGEGPVIAMIGEYDALPGLGHEIATTKKPTGKNGHGCGHNLLGVGSMSAALSAAEAMKKLDIHGTIRYYGCPTEEGGYAKVYMVRDGLFKGIDAVVRWHPINATYVSMASCLANRSVKYVFHGKSAHAASNPHLGRSALDAAILMDIGVNYMREHMPTSVRVHSVITNGGKAPNIVPDLSEIWYYIRAPKRVDVDEVFARMEKIAQGAAMATETTVDINVLGASSDVLPNKKLCDRMLENLKRVGPPAFTDEDKAFAKALNEGLKPQDKVKFMRMFGINDSSMGEKDLHDTISTNMCEGTVTPYSSDSGDVSWQAPTCQVFITGQTIGTANHSWQQVVCSGMEIGHKAMICAGQTLSMTALDIMTDSELLREAKEEFDEQCRMYPYVNPLPKNMKPQK